MCLLARSLQHQVYCSSCLEQTLSFMCGAKVNVGSWTVFRPTDDLE